MTGCQGLSFPQGRAHSPYVTVTTSVLTPPPVVTYTSFFPAVPVDAVAGVQEMAVELVKVTVAQATFPRLIVAPLTNPVPTMSMGVTALRARAVGLADDTVGGPTSLAKQHRGSYLGAEHT